MNFPNWTVCDKDILRHGLDTFRQIEPSSYVLYIAKHLYVIVFSLLVWLIGWLFVLFCFVCFVCLVVCLFDNRIISNYQIISNYRIMSTFADHVWLQCVGSLRGVWRQGALHQPTARLLPPHCSSHRGWRFHISWSCCYFLLICIFRCDSIF